MVDNILDLKVYFPVPDLQVYVSQFLTRIDACENITLPQLHCKQ